MIAFYWLDKETGECTVKGVRNGYPVALVHSTIKNPEPDSRYITYFGERVSILIYCYCLNTFKKEYQYYELLLLTST